MIKTFLILLAAFVIGSLIFFWFIYGSGLTSIKETFESIYYRIGLGQKTSAETNQEEEHFEFDYDKFKDIEYDIYFDEEAKEFILTYKNLKGKNSKGCLFVAKISLESGNHTICDICKTNSSANISCSVEDSPRTYIATFYVKGED